MHCFECTHWHTRHERRYSTGEVIVTEQSVADHGRCTSLKLETAADFGCTKFEAQLSPLDHVSIETMEGAPWQNWDMIPCPDCAGEGGGGGRAHLCVGTGQVRRYHDGMIVGEAIRKHPKQIEWEKQQGIVPRPDPGTILKPLPDKSEMLGGLTTGHSGDPLS